jgi:zinc transport system substrate-binding protein
MRSRKRILTLLAAVFVIATSCGQREETPSIVSVSIQPLEYLVDRLTGGSLDVNVMVPSGSSHGTFSPTPLQFQRLSDSNLYIRIGYLGYEQAWIRRLRELNPDMKVVNLSDYTDLIRGEEIDHGDHVHEGGIDPHIWMSPAVVLGILPVIRDAIAEAFPAYREMIMENYPMLESEVEDIHLVFTGLSETLSKRSFMIFHPALTYLARDYGLEQVSIEHEGKEPSPARLAQLIRKAREYPITVIFIQEEYDIRNARLISEETGARIVQVNPLGYDWLGSMHELAQTLKENMQ